MVTPQGNEGYDSSVSRSLRTGHKVDELADDDGDAEISISLGLSKLEIYGCYSPISVYH